MDPDAPRLKEGGYRSQKLSEGPRGNVEAERHGSKLPNSVLDGYPQEPLESRIHWDMQISVGQVDGGC